MRVYKSESGKAALRASYDRLLGMWGIEVEERDLEGSFGRTHAILAGDPKAPPLLMFHGVGDDSSLMWVENAAALSRRFRLIAVDTMGGAGKSEPGPRYDEGFDLAAWYGDVLDALGIGEAYATGVSYGAYHCQHILRSYPKRIARVVGIAGFVAVEGGSRSGLASMLALARAFLPEALIPTRGGAARLASKLAGPDPEGVLEAEEIGEHFRLLMRHYRAQAQFNHRRPSLSRDELDLIRDRSLFLIGGSDVMISAADALRANEALRMNLKTIAGAGHGVNQTRARDIEAEIVGFLLGGPAAG